MGILLSYFFVVGVREIIRLVECIEYSFDQNRKRYEEMASPNLPSPNFLMQQIKTQQSQLSTKLKLFEKEKVAFRKKENPFHTFYR